MWVALLLRHWRGALAGLAIAALLVGLLAWGRSKFEQGKLAGKTEQVDADTQVYKAELAKRDGLLAQSQAAAHQQEVEIQRLSDNANTLAAQLSNTAARAASATQQVSTVSDTDLFTDVRHKLGLQPLSAPLVFSPGELRAIDERVTSYDFHVEQINLMLKAQDNFKAQIGALDNLRDELIKQRDAQGAFALQIQGHYVACYNALPHKRNIVLTILTFGLKGKPKKLNLPLPASLKP